MNVNCPFCPTVERLTQRVTPRASPWLPIVLIVVVLGSAMLASVLIPDSRGFSTRDFAPREPVVYRGKLL